MADVSLTDPLSRVFILRDDTWEKHILKRHSEMKPHRALVEQAVTSPLSIWTTHISADCRVCYGDGPRANVLVAAVVDVALGVVKTAHLVKKTTGERLEWLRPTLLRGS